MSTDIQKIPSIDELYRESELLDLSKSSRLAALLNMQPRKEWIKEHPFLKNEKTKKPLQYIPIGIIEWLLTRLFIQWHVEIRETKLIANAVTVIIRLHYKDPVSGQMLWQDGIGAQPLQTEKDAGATDFNRLKTNSVSIAAPAAESYAIKDAAEKLGRLFGKDISRDITLQYEADMMHKASAIENRAKHILDDGTGNN